ncbi:MAG: general stress protein 26 [Candidatus Promineifilaceae bacterium]|jgi:general stress protein 26
MTTLESRIHAIIARPHLACLATTTPDGKPWVRYVMPWATADFVLRMSTYLDSRKIDQITASPEVHLTCGVTNPMCAESYLQIQGIGSVSSSKEERHFFWNDMLSELFDGPDDPRYGVLIVTPYRIELHTVGQPRSEVWEAKPA